VIAEMTGSCAIARLSEAVAKIETGPGPPGSPCRAAALWALAYQLWAQAWQTAEERAEAQRLVSRLERLLRAEEGHLQ
jgi:hypothetical protein